MSKGGGDEGDSPSIVESLESIKMYPIEHGLNDPFQGRVMVTIMKTSHSSQLGDPILREDLILNEVQGENTFSIVTVIEQVAEMSPIRRLDV